MPVSKLCACAAVMSAALVNVTVAVLPDTVTV